MRNEILAFNRVGFKVAATIHSDWKISVCAKDVLDFEVSRAVDFDRIQFRWTHRNNYLHSAAVTEAALNTHIQHSFPDLDFENVYQIFVGSEHYTLRPLAEYYIGRAIDFNGIESTQIVRFFYFYAISFNMLAWNNKTASEYWQSSKWKQ